MTKQETEVTGAIGGKMAAEVKRYSKGPKGERRISGTYKRDK